MVFKLIGSFLLIAVLAVDQYHATLQYLQTPTAVEIADGQTALFTCHALYAQAVHWNINGHGQNNPKSKALGVNVVTYNDDRNSSIKYSNLTIPANSMTNGARIVCLLYGTEKSPAAPTVSLRVQETYEPVRDILLTNISYSINVLWSFPPHLPSLPPTGYNITIINTTTEESISQATVSHTNYTFQLEPEHLCSILWIRVVAFSQLLGGHTADHVWSLGGAVEPNSIVEGLKYIERDVLELSVGFKVAGYCLDQLVSIVLETSCDNSTLSNTTDASNIDTSGVVSGPHELSIQELPEDSRCSYQIILFTITNRTTPSQSMLYDTFDLTNVQFTSQINAICLECCFISGSSAQGCHAEQQDFRNNAIVRSFNASRVNGSLTTGTQCFESDPGDYTVIVYDINSDDTLSEDPYTSSRVIVPTRPPLPTSTVLPTMSPTSSGGSTIGTIAVIVAVVIVGGVCLITLIATVIIIIALCWNNWKKYERVEHKAQLDDAGYISEESALSVILNKLDVMNPPATYYICAMTNAMNENELYEKQLLLGKPYPVTNKPSASLKHDSEESSL